MHERHLLPSEIDLLLDGEVGFGVAPLSAHVEACPTCRTRLAGTRVVVGALEDLPHFVPPARFADTVMAQVQVVEPWHAAVVDAALRLVPGSRPLRVLTGITALVAASAISASAVWLVFRADVALYAFTLIADRARAALVSGVATLIGDAFGQAGLDALRSGGLAGLAMGGGLLFAVVGGAAVGIRSLAAAARRTRE